MKGQCLSNNLSNEFDIVNIPLFWLFVLSYPILYSMRTFLNVSIEGFYSGGVWIILQVYKGVLLQALLGALIVVMAINPG